MISTAALAAVPGAFADESSSRIDLWPHGAPGGGGPAGPLSTDHKGAVSHVASPCLEIFVPRRPTGAAMLIAGGGGYKRIEMQSEAYPAAAWLQERGVTAFVLTYRLPTEDWNDGPVVSLQDAQRAIRIIRLHADRLRLDPDRVGALGFSAGGHLLGMAATRAAAKTYEAVDAADELSARLDCAALIYPVITLQRPYDKTSTRRSLVGDHPAAGAEAACSVETHVRAGCPAMFLVQAEDDPISNPQNTLIMASACERAGVPVDMHRFSTGGHGFGMGKAGTPTVQWPSFYETWLRSREFMA